MNRYIGIVFEFVNTKERFLVLEHTKDLVYIVLLNNIDDFLCMKFDFFYKNQVNGRIKKVSEY